MDFDIKMFDDETVTLLTFDNLINIDEDHVDELRDALDDQFGERHPGCAKRD